MKSSLSSPPDHAEALALAEHITDHLCENEYDIGGRSTLLDCVVEALAARQPVGQIDEAAVLRRAAAVLYMWEDDPNLTGYMGDFKDACGILELLAQHAAPPAQAVDLEQFNALAALANAVIHHGDQSPMKNGVFAEAERLLALIDGKAVQP